MRNYKTVHGFTLVELLVVISIIAMLLAVLIPALNKARNIARCVVCQNSIRQLSMAWTTYATSNNGRLVGGFVGVSGVATPPLEPHMSSAWVEIPSSKSGVYVPYNGNDWPDAQSLEDKDRGIMKGLLYPYVKTLDVYHCAADWRLQNNWSFKPARRSYSIGGGMNVPSTYVKNAKIISQIRRTSERYVFVEATDPRGWNEGYWDIDAQRRGRAQWWSGVAGWHVNRTNWGFADGHAETQKWKDKRTISLANERDYTKWPGMIGPASINNPDLLWIFDRREYTPKREGESL